MDHTLMRHIATGLATLYFVSVALAQSSAPESKSVAPNVELSAAVRQELEKLALSNIPIAPLKTVRFSVESGSTSQRLDFFYERLDSGLWGVAQLTNTGRGGVVQRQLSLEGLVLLGGTLEASSEIELPIFIPGTRFLPFGAVKKTIQTNAVYQTESIAGDLATLTSPVAGAKFSYELSFQTRAGSRTVNNEVKASCSVENGADASALNPKLRGSYLPVTCEESRNGQASTRQYAYLVDSRLYVVTAILSGANKGVYKFSEVEYAEPK